MSYRVFFIRLRYECLKSDKPFKNCPKYAKWFIDLSEEPDARNVKFKGGFPVMAKITGMLTANICRQFFFLININTAASTRCLVENFQLVCYSQRVNATSQHNDSGSSRCSKWPNDRMVAVVKHCWLLVQGRGECRERWLKNTTG